MTHLVTQCAAVNTHCVPIKAAPHKYWFSEFIKATCQHHSPCSPSSPPTTRPLLELPLTPQTYLLYAGCLLTDIVVDDVDVVSIVIVPATAVGVVTTAVGVFVGLLSVTVVERLTDSVVAAKIEIR